MTAPTDAERDLQGRLHRCEEEIERLEEKRDALTHELADLTADYDNKCSQAKTYKDALGAARRERDEAIQEWNRIAGGAQDLHEDYVTACSDRDAARRERDEALKRVDFLAGTAWATRTAMAEAHAERLQGELTKALDVGRTNFETALSISEKRDALAARVEALTAALRWLHKAYEQEGGLQLEAYEGSLIYLPIIEEALSSVPEPAGPEDYSKYETISGPAWTLPGDRGEASPRAASSLAAPSEPSCVVDIEVIKAAIEALDVAEPLLLTNGNGSAWPTACFSLVRLRAALTTQPASGEPRVQDAAQPEGVPE